MKKKLLALLMLLLLVAGAVGGKYYHDGLPKYEEKQCLLDKEHQTVIMILKVMPEKKAYGIFALVRMAMPWMGLVDIRDFNKAPLIKIDCKTLEPLDAQ